MEIVEIELSVNLSRKLQCKLVQDAIRKTLRELKTREVILPATAIQTLDSFDPTSHSFGRRDDGIVMPTLQRQLPLQPLCLATMLRFILKEHVPGSVFAISWIVARHCSGSASSHILKPWWGNVNSCDCCGPTPQPSLTAYQGCSKSPSLGTPIPVKDRKGGKE